MASALVHIRGNVSTRMPATPLLMGAIEKLAKTGELAGFSIQDMIDMLNGGLSVADLFEVLACCLHDKRKPHA
jgi:hypothetical protein